MEEKDLEKEQKQSMMRHSMAHILAKALLQLYPDTKLTIGPEIEDGFYYDVDSEHNFVPEDFDAIEKKMGEIIAKNEDFVRREIPRAEALKLFAGNKYKVEIISDLPEDAIISIYYTGDDFFDLCRGPHVENTKFLRGFAYKFNRVSGAYWRGSEKNKMIQRIYFYGFADKKDLKEHLALLQEARERDHRKIGKDLGIFMFSDVVGKGLPMWLPNGFTARRLLSDYIMNKEIALGYKHVMTPSLGSKELYTTSGHWDHYQEDMFPAMVRDNETYVLRPMNCPHHMMIYKNFMHSYKDLPIRIAEIANDFRFEASGNLTGIERTRAFTQNDSHIFCRPDQIESEIKGVIELILDVYKDFGLDGYEFRLSLRDVNNKEKYFGNDELWEKSESALRRILQNSGAKFYEAPGEAAFYGPKIDVQVKSAIGHDVTLSTVQLDYQLPEKFELEYIDENSQKARPVVIHRAILGSLDRTMAFILEETKGLLPLWLAPVQVKVLGITEANDKYVSEICQKLLDEGFRAEADLRNEKINYKIREASKEKVPYMIIVGDQEQQNGTISIRGRGFENKSGLALDEFVARLKQELKNKSLR